MKQSEIQNMALADCPIRNILSRISNKWSLLVLFTLEQSPKMRFNTLRRNIPDISQKMLTVTLRTLEQDGLIYRKAYPEVPPRVEYSLTERGQSLLPNINNLITWALKNMESILKDRSQHAALK
jgi:DNA-binding HxlR family transcriptional regulator